MVKADEFDQITEKLMKTADEISKAKRPAYTVGNVDVLHNFKSVAQRLGISPGQALAVYMTKHYDAIITALTKPELPQAEEITGRFADAINYLKMGYALLQEGKSGEANAKPAQPVKNDLTDFFAKRLAEQEKAEQECAKQRQLWPDSLKQWVGPKLTTTLQDEREQRGKLLGATLSDQAQIQALGEHMQRARQSEAKSLQPESAPRSLAEQCHQSGVWSVGIQDYEGRGASDGCSTPSAQKAPDTTVLLFALPRDTSPL